MEKAIEIGNLTKRYGGKKAVDDLTLDIPKGSVFALLGENGAGKSTTIKILTGLLQADGGKAFVLGQDAWVNAQSLRRRVGYVPERPRFYDWMRVGEIGWFTAGFHHRNYLATYNDYVQKFQLSPQAKLKTLSKGQYAKVALALALAIEPEVLILDEPTSGLDLLVRREFLQSMIGLASEGRTIVIASHLIAEVERVASHVAFLGGSKLLLSASMEELRKRVVKYSVRFDDQAPDLAPLGNVLQRNGSGKLTQAVVLDPQADKANELAAAASVVDVEESPLGLEDVYCALLAQNEGEKE
ncbi:MAG: ABC transporter ATP-binding protein [Gemmataceae bacterium]